jgi:hypothetical protein
LKNENGDTVQIIVSRIGLQKNYSTFKIGELVTVSGDTVRLNQELVIVVKLFNKYKW